MKKTLLSIAAALLLAGGAEPTSAQVEVLLSSALEACECDWFAVAREQARRKSADPASLDRTGLAKLMNYLQRRGFSVEQARYACRPTDDSAADR